MKLMTLITYIGLFPTVLILSRLYFKEIKYLCYFISQFNIIYSILCLHSQECITLFYLI